MSPASRLKHHQIWNTVKSFANARELGKILLVESVILGFGFRSAAQGIRNAANDLNPESGFYW